MSGEPEERTPSRVRFARPLFWAAVAVSFVMSVLPNPPHVTGVSDKVEHAAAFLGLAILGRLAYPAVRKRVLLLWLAAFGALIELVQAIPGLNRHADPLDWAADTIAVLAVFVVIALWRRQSLAPRA